MPGLSLQEQEQLDELYEYIEHQCRTFVGYPCSGWMDYMPLSRFLKFPLNNVGDPFVPSTYRLNTKAFEQEVLTWFAELTHADRANFWGYVTNGGSEGNLYGLYLAREMIPDGLVYYSEETHYSVSKILRMLKMPSIMIRSLPSGEIDYEDLTETIRIHREVPPIVFATIGTTMTEGIDDIGRIRALLKEMAIPQSYIHCDAALDGMTLPFIEGAPVWDFQAGIDSLSISGHKFIGSPVPCGIALAKKANVDRIARSIEYVGTLDTTVTGSRNGITPLFLWYAIRKAGLEGFRRMVDECIENAKCAVSVFSDAGIHAWRNPWAITVVVPRPPASVLDKWQIAVQGDRAHVILMPHVTREQTDALVADIVAAQTTEVDA